MTRIAPEVTVGFAQEPIGICRCSQCGRTVPDGDKLIVDGKQVWCEGCYRLMASPDGSGDIPSKWL